MTISIDQVKELRNRTNISLGECTKALNETNGDVEAAIDVLKKRGAIKAADKAGRVAVSGSLYSYIHPGNKIGVLVEINCETDFAAKSDEFQKFCEDVALQIAAMNPLAVRKEDISALDVFKQAQIFDAQLPDKIRNNKAQCEKVISGKFDKWYSEICLLTQESVVHPKKPIELLRVELVAKIGENVSIRRFVRWELGEGIEVQKKDFGQEVASLIGVQVTK